MNQLNFFIASEIVGGIGDSIDTRFLSFHTQNPQVYEAICYLARDLKRKGAKRIGMKMLFEYLRVSSLRTSGRDFKLNNSYTSRYARLIVDREPDLADLFELRGRGAA